MITNFKIFEEINQGELEIGDYVICEESINDNLKDFISNNIGSFSGFSEKGHPYIYIIKYENVPDFLLERDWFNNNCRRMCRREIKYWSKNIEDLESILAVKKI